MLVGIGHGQMDGKKLEELMLAFMNGEFDVFGGNHHYRKGLDECQYDFHQ
jgi:transcription-repair coupling factor (superfamily II helicase)